MYFISGGLVDIISAYTFSIIKALSVLCVSNTELGKINAVLSALESILPIVAIQGYSYIWKLTDITYPGTIFFVSSGIFFGNKSQTSDPQGSPAVSGQVLKQKKSCQVVTSLLSLFMNYWGH